MTTNTFSLRSLWQMGSLTLLLAALSLPALSQKFAYIDSEYVLQHMPEYASAQTELNNYAIQWQAEIEAKLEAADRLEVAYRAERVLLTPEMRVKREEKLNNHLRTAETFLRNIQ